MCRGVCCVLNALDDPNIPDCVKEDQTCITAAYVWQEADKSWLIFDQFIPKECNMESKSIVSEDTRLCLKAEYQKAYDDHQHPNHGAAVAIMDLMNALTWAEKELSTAWSHV
jgi:hypothetical protein